MSARAIEVGVSATRDEGPNPGRFWLDVRTEDGRHLSAVLTAEQMQRLAQRIQTHLALREAV